MTVQNERDAGTMPLHLFALRHGESFGNLAARLEEAGDLIRFRAINQGSYTHDFRLTTKGQIQAKAAGGWLQQHFPVFDRYLVSGYTRAQETAALLNLVAANWFIDPRLNERYTGEYSRLPLAERQARFPEAHAMREQHPFYWQPEGGESLYTVSQRLEAVLGTLSRECGNCSVIMVCHGEVMRVLRKLLTRMTDEDYTRYHHGVQIHNGEIHHYTRVHPTDAADVRPYFTWVRNVRVASTEAGVWTEIVRPTFTNEALLERVAQKPIAVVE